MGWLAVCLVGVLLTGSRAMPVEEEFETINQDSDELAELFTRLFVPTREARNLELEMDNEIEEEEGEDKAIEGAMQETNTQEISRFNNYMDAIYRRMNAALRAKQMDPMVLNLDQKVKKESGAKKVKDVKKRVERDAADSDSESELAKAEEEDEMEHRVGKPEKKANGNKNKNNKERKDKKEKNKGTAKDNSKNKEKKEKNKVGKEEKKAAAKQKRKEEKEKGKKEKEKAKKEKELAKAAKAEKKAAKAAKAEKKEAKAANKQTRESRSGDKVKKHGQHHNKRTAKKNKDGEAKGNKGGKKSNKNGKEQGKSKKGNEKKKGEKKGKGKGNARSDKETETKVMGSLAGIATLRRSGDVAVQDEENHKVVTSSFTVGPLQLEVSKTLGQGKSRTVKSAKATTDVMKGTMVLKVKPDGSAHVKKVVFSKPDSVDVKGSLSDNKPRSISYLKNSVNRMRPIAAQKVLKTARYVLKAPATVKQ